MVVNCGECKYLKLMNNIYFCIKNERKSSPNQIVICNKFVKK